MLLEIDQSKELWYKSPLSVNGLEVIRKQIPLIAMFDIKSVTGVELQFCIKTLALFILDNLKMY